MEISIHTDSHITGSESFAEKMKEELSKKLNRFADYLTNIAVFFADENRSKPGTHDKRCTIEVRPKNKKPEAVTHHADTLDHAFNGAVDKIKSLLDTLTGKEQNRQ